MSENVNLSARLREAAQILADASERTFAAAAAQRTQPKSKEDEMKDDTKPVHPAKGVVIGALGLLAAVVGGVIVAVVLAGIGGALAAVSAIGGVTVAVIVLVGAAGGALLSVLLIIVSLVRLIWLAIRTIFNVSAKEKTDA